MTTFQETGLAKLRHRGANGYSRRHGCSRTKGRSRWVVLATLLLFVVLPGPSADASPVRSLAAVKTCPGDDIATKVNQAGKIVGGTARVLGPPTKTGVYNVTFTIKHILKGKKADFADLRGFLRLQFANKIGGAKHQCIEKTDVIEVPVRANITRGKKYIVFIDEVEPKIFKPHGEPVIRNRENLRAVNASLCGVTPELFGMGVKHDVDLMKTLSLECKMKGRKRGAGQQYKLRWFKNGEKLHAGTSKNNRIRIKRRKLEITDVKQTDEGEYECRAVSPRCGTVSLKTTVSVKPEQPAIESPLYTGKPCEADGFCLNGGTCTFLSVVGTMICQCAEGYKGERCDHKDALHTDTAFQLESWTLARTI